jgi:KRAB domain-containing zinc finger protein
MLFPLVLQSTINVLEATQVEKRAHCCDVCNKSFCQKAYLKRHPCVHSAKKASCCNVSKKSFSQKDYMKDHLRIHGEERPYGRHVCNS